MHFRFTLKIAYRRRRPYVSYLALRASLADHGNDLAEWVKGVT